LKENGTFGAKAMVLVVSSHDAHDIMDFEQVVGVHLSYPEKKYKLAWLELVDRYVIPKFTRLLTPKKTDLDPDQQVLAGIQKKGKGFNPGFDQLKNISDSLSIPMLVILHAENGELSAGSYNEQGQEIIQWADSAHVRLVKDMDCKFNHDDYRDNIHLNTHGQRKLANLFKKLL
jgi:hypothetical protein